MKGGGKVVAKDLFDTKFNFSEDSVFNEVGASTKGDTCVKGQRAVLPWLPPLLKEASLPRKPTWHKG
jgi:hypothetical protein